VGVRGGGRRARAVHNHNGRRPGRRRRRSAPKSGRGPQKTKAGGVTRRHQTAVHASVRRRDGCLPSPRRWKKSTQSAGAATPRRRRGAVRAATSVPCIGRAAPGIGAVPPMGQSEADRGDRSHRPKYDAQSTGQIGWRASVAPNFEQTTIDLFVHRPESASGMGQLGCAHVTVRINAVANVRIVAVAGCPVLAPARAPQSQWHLVSLRLPACCWPALVSRPPVHLPILSHNSTDPRVPLLVVCTFDACTHTHPPNGAGLFSHRSVARSLCVHPVCVLTFILPAPPSSGVSPSLSSWALNAPPLSHPPAVLPFFVLFWSPPASLLDVRSCRGA